MQNLQEKNLKTKKYYRHTGHPGGIKEINSREIIRKNKPGETLKLAIKRMLPGGVLGRKQLTKVKIYAGEDHPHAAQNPKLLDLGKLNSKKFNKKLIWKLQLKQLQKNIKLI